MERTGYKFAPGFVEDLIDDLHAKPLATLIRKTAPTVVEGVEPTQLQIVCSHLFQAVPSGTSLVTFDLFNVDSYVDRTLAKFCAEVVYAVAAEHEISVQRLREWLERTFITPRGMRRIIAEGVDHTARMPNSLVRDLVDRHLLTAEWSSAKRWYTLTNDRLVSVIRQLNIPSKDEIRPVVDAARPSAGRSKYHE